jgi:glucose-6-phosphate 1-dehydrogenase
MEPPSSVTGDALQTARDTVLAQVTVDTSITGVRGQYAEYRKESGVAVDSDTETYFRCTLTVDTDRWRGVPFIVEAGKALNNKAADVTIHFKDSTTLHMEDIKSSTGMDAYEHVFLDAIMGNMSSFVSMTGALEQWRIAVDMQGHIATTPLHIYPVGSSAENISKI